MCGQSIIESVNRLNTIANLSSVQISNALNES